MVKRLYVGQIYLDNVGLNATPGAAQDSTIEAGDYG